MRIIISPAKKMNVDTDSFAVEAPPRFLAETRRLMAAHYLITGRRYRPSVSAERIYAGRWCPALRERYHAAACSGFNFARSAEDTLDPCLAKLFRELSEDAYRHAEELMSILERAMQG